VEPFVAPGKPSDQLERWLHQASTQLCDWLGHAADGSPLPTLSVVPPVEPEAIGRSPGQLLADLQLVMDGAFNPGHPGALAHLDPPPLTASIVADLICAGLNNNLLAEELSPSLSHLERNLCRWLAESLGLPEGSGGVPASGGSLCNLMALVAARRSRGLASSDDAVVLCGADAHVSLRKAVAVMGLPPSCLRHVPIDRQGRLQPEALEDQLTGLSRQGIPVIAVVATAGTTVLGAVDPLPSLASLCRRHGVWLHVDGAIGAVFALSPRHRPLMAGLEQADSITMNPQKLLGITKTSALLLVADRGVLHEAFATGLPYMEPSWGGGHGGECGLQGTRPAEILKLWLGLRQLGLQGIAELIDAAIERRHRLESMLATDQRLLILAGPLHLLAFRPADVSPAAAEAWSDHTRQILLEHQLMLSRPRYRGYHHLKAVLGNPHTRHQDLERLAGIVHRGLDEL
jgi:glutamate/tyrosine decarboxylase-like PLP-dependent enzyme